MFMYHSTKFFREIHFEKYHLTHINENCHINQIFMKEFLKRAKLVSLNAYMKKDSCNIQQSI